VESSAEDSKVAYHHNTATNPPKRMNSRPKSDTEVNPKYQDVWAALLFAAHLAVMAWLAFGKGLSYLKYDATHADNGGGGDNPAVNIKSDSLVKMVCGGLLSTLLAGIFSLFWLKFLIKQGEAAVKGMLYGSIAIQAMGVVASFLSGQVRTHARRQPSPPPLPHNSPHPPPPHLRRCGWGSWGPSSWP
jgi:hypothetical protein